MTTRARHDERQIRSASWLLAFACLVHALTVFTGCSDDTSDPVDEDVALSGGAATVSDASSHAFEFPAPNLSGASFNRHVDGDAVFERTFVTAPAPRFGGLGPLFNASSCVSCHARNGSTRDSRLLRVSLPGLAPDGGPLPLPGYGTQIQDHAVFGKPAEASIVMREVAAHGSYGDGGDYALIGFAPDMDDEYLPYDESFQRSLRFAPPVFGLGLLEAISEADILALEDPNDADSDGVSGRANRVPDLETGGVSLGRFGWKAGAASLVQQSAGAYHADMGLTNPFHPVDESDGRPGMDDGLPDDPEVDGETVELAAFYVRTLAVPARRNPDDPSVRRGSQLFEDLGCASCHVPRLMTGPNANPPEFANQVIRPFTDMLLHDMGEGLADHRPEYLADGREWRTPPLWGVGLRRLVNGHEQFLHDGRARGLEEAILWHGGEAALAQNRYRMLPLDDRRAVMAFLESL